MTVKISNVGDTVLLQKMVPRMLFVGDGLVTRGYMPSGDPVAIVIEHVHADSITDNSGNHYNVLPALQDHYYSALTTTSDSVTLSKRTHERLLSESHFLAALMAAGVDNWEGYAEACHHDDEDNDDDE